MTNRLVNLRAVEVLEAAALVLSIPDWHCKKDCARAGSGVGLGIGSLDPAAQSFCAVGALIAANNALRYSMSVQTHAMSALHAEVPGGRCIPLWNDRPGRTGLQVAKKMWAAAQRLRDQNE